MADFCEQLDKKSQAMNAAKWPCKFKNEFSSKLDILFKWPVTRYIFYIKTLKMNRK
jgi:hypothetical protein